MICVAHERGAFGDLQGQALMLPADLLISVLPHEADDRQHDGIQLDLRVYKAVRLRRDACRDGWPQLDPASVSSVEGADDEGSEEKLAQKRLR